MTTVDVGKSMGGEEVYEVEQENIAYKMCACAVACLLARSLARTVQENSFWRMKEFLFLWSINLAYIFKQLSISLWSQQQQQQQMEYGANTRNTHQPTQTN